MTLCGKKTHCEFTEWLLYSVLIVLVFGCVSTVYAQGFSVSQDAINATLDERQRALGIRLDKIEALLQYGMFGLVGNLVAHLYQINANRKHKREDG